jgi:hypothetical protein
MTQGEYMTIVKYCLEEDGKLAPPTVEFEAGDAIRFESDKPVYVLVNGSVAIQALRSFSLGEISAEIEDGVIFVRPPCWPIHTNKDGRLGSAGGGQ